jgi:hypothetical protein
MALVTLYDSATGQPHRVHAVDVADILAHGGYQLTPPAPADAPALASETAPVDEGITALPSEDEPPAVEAETAERPHRSHRRRA